jgi:hypothetical protein
MSRTLAVGLVMGSLALGRGFAVAPSQSPPAPQITATTDDLERRDRRVTDDDLRILLKAHELLNNDALWNRKR